MLEAVVIYWYFYENRKTFEEINLGFQESLKEQMKSERMKVDLITNVSHDLKTPLTSIISYVELLSKEELPEAARDYVNILADKSGRLKNIVSDLFDLAKSTSGNLPLNMENLDLKKLIEQTLGDMEDEIEKSNIRIKTTLTESPVYIYSDGKKLYRVFQNIIGNALKYSLQGTRIFIDMEVDNKIVNVVIKNTASYDMDFTAEEILQRFNRGDKSRTTEGSGLGLSIAESFTRACGGNFKVEIDGDQFKVKLRFTISGVVPLPEMDN
jgi:signal transduction histidine kinase